MKVAVVGSRSIKDYQTVKNILNNYEITELISGGAIGIDQLAEQYARLNNIPTTIFPAEWDEYGRAAGMIRNIKIISEADEVIAIWDGDSKGTKNSIDQAKRQNKLLHLYTINDHGIYMKNIKLLSNPTDELF